MAAYQIPLGAKVESVTINRAAVADNIPSRAIMIGSNVWAKRTAWDDVIKRNVDVDQDAILKYHFERVNTYYYIIIARLNTDIRGEVVSDDITVEYVRLSENQYADLAKQVNEMGQFNSLLLEKVTKKGENGKDYSYVDVTVSNYQNIPEACYAKVDQMLATEGMIDKIWEMIDVSTSITVEQYEKKLQELSKDPVAVMSAPQQALPQPVRQESALPRRVEAPAARSQAVPTGQVRQIVRPNAGAQVPATGASQRPAVQQSAGQAATIRPKAVSPTVSGATIQPATSARGFSGENDMAMADPMSDFESGDFESGGL